MIKAVNTPNENERLEALFSYNILDTLPEKEYDNIVKLASHICDVPIAMITFMGEAVQTIKSVEGMDISQAPRDISFCGHAIMNPDKPMVVNNTLEDKRFHDNPHVVDAGVRFYAGVPILSDNEKAIGTICIFDVQPKELTEHQLGSLLRLGEQVEILLQLHKTTHKLTESQRHLEVQNTSLKEFSYMISHDMKAPVRNLRQLSDILYEDYKAILPEEAQQIVKMLKDSSQQAISLIEGIIEYSKSSHEVQLDVSRLSKSDIENIITNSIKIPDNFSVSISMDVDYISIPRTPFTQIIINLLSNCLKYSDKKSSSINIDISGGSTIYRIQVRDNGMGIPADRINKVFNLFYKIEENLPREGTSTGLGLAIVKKLVRNMGGEISVASTAGEGTTMSFTLLRHF